MFGIWVRAAGLCVVLAALFAACESKECGHNRDCDNGEKVCVLGKCYSCEIYPCGRYQACVGGKCQPSGCSSNRDCAEGSVCFEGACVVPDGGVAERPRTPPLPGAACPKQGQTCTNASDCAGGICQDFLFLGFKICSHRCRLDGECCAGYQCHPAPGQSYGFCVPSCTQAQDCQNRFAALPQCTTDKHCWTFGATGKACEQASDCDTKKQLNCVSPGDIGFKICTRPCLDSKECDSDSVCDTVRPTLKYCVPKCKSDADCHEYAWLNTCHKRGYCWRK